MAHPREHHPRRREGGGVRDHRNGGYVGVKVATARQMAELDRVTIEQYGIPSLVLMENAGRSCTERILRILQEKVGVPEEASVAIVCGRGNNGGGGGGVARHPPNRGGAVEAINLSLATVFAVDVPTGIDATTGRILGEAIRADYTGTFGLLKLGQVLLPGSIHCGETDIYDIGIPSKAVFDADIKTEALEERVVKSMLSIRPPDFHKGDAGRVYLIGGSPGMTGAPCLAGRAAMRMGAGLITVVVPKSLLPVVEAKLLEVMSYGVEDGGSGHFLKSCVPELLETISRADFVVVGPGAGAYPGAEEFLAELIPRIRVPFLIDADGLNAVAGQVRVLREATTPCLITPHPGEMSRLA